MWRKFQLLVLITGAPLAALIFLFSDSPRWNWLSRSSEVILFSYGLTGGLAGLVKYGLRGEEVPSPSEFAGFCLPTRQNYTTPENQKPPWIKAAMLIAVAFTTLGFAACLVVSFLDNGVTISTREPFTVSHPGDYTLFVNQAQSGHPGEFTIRPSAGGKAIVRKPIWGTEELRINERHYDAIGNFAVILPGSYQIVAPDNLNMDDMHLAPQVKVVSIFETMVVFILGIFFFVRSLPLFFRCIRSL